MEKNKLKMFKKGYILLVGNAPLYLDKNQNIFLGGDNLKIPIFMSNIGSIEIIERRARYMLKKENELKITTREVVLIEQDMKMGEPDTKQHKCPKCGTIEYCKTMVINGIYEYRCRKCSCKWQEGS